MDTKKIGAFLKQFRKEKNLTQEQLAEKFGVSTRTVSIQWFSELNAEYAILLERKNNFYAEYRKTKSEMQDWIVAQKIVQEILKKDEQKKIAVV